MARKRTRISTLALGGCLGLAVGLAGVASAEDVPEGTVMDKSNIDKLKGMTFDGHKVSDLLAGQQEKVIRQFGLTMKLVKATPIVQDPKIAELTKQFAGQAKLDDKKILQNYTTGMPFPELKLDDPDAGIKLTYNILRFGWLGDAIDLDPIVFMIVNGNKGLEREQGWHYKRYILSGRVQEPHVEDANITKYEGLINKYPNDLAGLGLLTVNYADGRFPDVYVYIKAFRRVRRLASSVWADPVQATDILFDETFGLNLSPTWYDAWNLKAKRWALGTAHGQIREVEYSEKDPDKRYPGMDFHTAPYWNYKDVWEPREVWEMEAVPPKNHLVKYRDMYIDSMPTAPVMYWQDLYDRKGDHWRSFTVGVRRGAWENTKDGLAISAVAFWDFQRMHATVFNGGKNWKFNDPNARAVDYSPEALPRFVN